MLGSEQRESGLTYEDLVKIGKVFASCVRLHGPDESDLGFALFLFLFNVLLTTETYSQDSGEIVFSLPSTRSSEVADVSNKYLDLSVYHCMTSDFATSHITDFVLGSQDPITSEAGNASHPPTSTRHVGTHRP